VQEPSQQAQRRTPDPDGLKAFRDDANAREKSNVEAYDRAVLTLSTASLGVSLTFIKDVVEPSAAILLPVLYTSWAMLTATVLITLISFLEALRSIRASSHAAPRYFMEGDDSAADIPQRFRNRMWRLTVASAFLFIGGLVSLALFVGTNIHHEATTMSKENRGPGVLEKGLPAGAFESFSTPQTQPTSEPAEQPVSPQSGTTPASTTGSSTSDAGKE
jgi:hypothetical protein